MLIFFYTDLIQILTYDDDDDDYDDNFISWLIFGVANKD